MHKNLAKLEAIKNGHHTFYDGVKCKHGHLSKRYTRNSACVQCSYTRKTVTLTKEQRKNNLATYQKKYSLINAKKIRQKTKEWALKNPEKAKLNAKISQANRRARKLKATPLWANKKEIKNIYTNCPKGFEVDHIIPLGSKIVCGLHVENNLQYLDTLSNRIKAASLIF